MKLYLRLAQKSGNGQGNDKIDRLGKTRDPVIFWAGIGELTLELDALAASRSRGSKADRKSRWKLAVVERKKCRRSKLDEAQNSVLKTWNRS